MDKDLTLKDMINNLTDCLQRSQEFIKERGEISSDLDTVTDDMLLLDDIEKSLEVCFELFEHINSDMVMVEAEQNKQNEKFEFPINIQKLRDYLAKYMILEFESPEECMQYFNTYDYQNFKTVDEMKQYQAEYGFGINGKWYHINFDEALDVWENMQNGPESNVVSVAHFAEDEKVKTAVLESDDLRGKTLKACYNIPGYLNLPREEKNQLYDLVKKCIAEDNLNLYIYESAHGGWECSFGQKNGGMLFLQEKEYPVELYYTRLDLNGSSNLEHEILGNRNDLLEAMQWHGQCNHVIEQIWDFDIKTCKKELFEFFNDVYNTALKKIERALLEEDMETEISSLDDKIQGAEKSTKKNSDVIKETNLQRDISQTYKEK